MRLEDAAAGSLDLVVVGYQFPNAGNYWDANWLLVRGDVRHPLGGWTFRDPCLTTFEVVQLARWFEGVAEGKVDPDLGYFTEPNLQFTYAEVPRPMIEVRLAYESSPPWLSLREERFDGTVMSFPLELNDLRVEASSLRSWLTEYPVREGR